MEKVSLKIKGGLFILLSCTYVHAGTMSMNKDKRVHTKSHHRKKEIKKLLTRFKREIIGITLFVIAGGGIGLAFWKNKQAACSEENHTDESQIPDSIVETKLGDQPEAVEAKQPQSPQALQNDISSSKTNHTNDSQADTKKVIDIKILNPYPEQKSRILPEASQSSSLSEEIKDKLQNASKGENKIKLSKVITRNYMLKVGFLDDKNIFYHSGYFLRIGSARAIFQYNIPSNTETETTIFTNNEDDISSYKRGIVYSEIVDSLSNQKKVDLISGFCRQSKEAFTPTDPQKIILSYYPSTSMVFFMDNHGYIIAYDHKNNRIVKKQNFHKERRKKLYKSIDVKGHLLAVAGDKEIDVYDLSLGKHKGSLNYEDGDLEDIKISLHPNGKALLIGGKTSKASFKKMDRRNPIRIWDFDKKEARMTPFKIDGMELLVQPLLYDQRCVLASNFEIHVWDIKEKKSKVTLTNAQFANSLKMHPNKKFLAYSGYFGIKIWHLAFGKEVFNLRLLHRKFHSIDFSPNGDSMVAILVSNINETCEILIFENINAMLNEWLADNVS